MPLVADPFPEDPAVVAVEVLVHLRGIDHRRIQDRRQLAAAWLQVHQCDVAVLDSVAPAARQEYQAVVDGPGHRTLPVGRRSDSAAVRAGVANLRVAIHRRIMVLHRVVERTVGSSAGGPVRPVSPR